MASLVILIRYQISSTGSIWLFCFGCLFVSYRLLLNWHILAPEQMRRYRGTQMFCYCFRCFRLTLKELLIPFHYCTKKRKHSFRILKVLFSSDTRQSMKRRITTARRTFSGYPFSMSICFILFSLEPNLVLEEIISALWTKAFIRLIYLGFLPALRKN